MKHHTIFERKDDEITKPGTVNEEALQKSKQKLASDREREEPEKFFYDSSITYSPKTSSIRPKYYHNFITKKIFSDKSFSLSNEKYKKTISVISPVKSTKNSRHSINKTTIFNLTGNNSLLNSKDMIMKTEPSHTTSRSYGNYGIFINASLNHSKLKKIVNNAKSTNKKEEICKFYVEILRRVELINFRRNLDNKNSSKN